jgi:hypothetical protein
MTPAALFSAIGEALANDAGLVLVIILILWAGAKKVWIWRRELERIETLLTDERVRQMGEINAMREERDRWRAMSLMQQGQRGPERPPPNPLEGD